LFKAIRGIKTFTRDIVLFWLNWVIKNNNNNYEQYNIIRHVVLYLNLFDEVVLDINCMSMFLGSGHKASKRWFGNSPFTYFTLRTSSYILLLTYFYLRTSHTFPSFSYAVHSVKMSPCKGDAKADTYYFLYLVLILLVRRILWRTILRGLMELSCFIIMLLGMGKI